MQTLSFLFLSFFVIAIAFIAKSHQQQNTTVSILDTLSNDPRFTILVSLLSNTTGSPILRLNSTSENTTIFAPTNSAWNASETTAPLDQTLTYHLLNGWVYTSNIDNSSLLYTLQSLTGNEPVDPPLPQVITATTDGGSYIELNGFATITEPNITCSNGVIHVIDSVLELPEELTDQVGDDTNYVYAFQALARAGLDQSFNDIGYSAVLPDNQAFETTISPGLWEYLHGTEEGLPDLRNVLQYHLLPANDAVSPVEVWYPQRFPEGVDLSVPTALAGENLTVHKMGEQIDFNDGQGGLQAITAGGAWYTIDKVLLPPDFSFLLPKLLLGLKLRSIWEGFVTTGLDSVINDPQESLTVFGPTDSAWEGYVGNSTLSNSTLEGILLYHLSQNVIGNFSEGMLIESSLALDTLVGQTQRIKVTYSEPENWLLNGVKVQETAHPADNGLVYVLEGVLLPPGNLTDGLILGGNYSTLVEAFVVADALTELNLASVALFAPEDAAFEALPAGWLNLLIAKPDKLKSVLRNHLVISSPVAYAYDLDLGVTNLTNVDLGVLTVNKTESSVEVVDAFGHVAKVLDYDNLASNGVFHRVDTILLPSGFFIDNLEVLEGLGIKTFLTALGYLPHLKDLVLNGTYTILAPTDEAFDNVKNLDKLLLKSDDLEETLRTHIIQGNVGSLEPNRTYATLNPEASLTVSADGKSVNLGGEEADESSEKNAKVLESSFSSDGYVYTLDTVLGVEKKKKGGLSTGAIVGIVIAVLIVVFLILALVIWRVRASKGYESVK